MSPPPTQRRQPAKKKPKPATRAATDVLRVRMYNVLFGDAILVSVPDRDAAGTTVTRHILIDVGNVTGKGGDDEVFDPVIKDVLKVLDGKPLDLYVMTHEHMDHVQGLLYAADRLGVDVTKKLDVQYAWLTASGEGPAYYDRHPDAKRKKLEAVEAHRTVARFLMASYLDGNPGAEIPKDALDDLYRFAAAAEDEPGKPAFARALAALLLNNDSQKTEKCVDYLRKLAPKKRTYFIHRETKLAGKHPFVEAKFEIWAPEEDTSDYYGRFRPLALGVTGGDGGVLPALAAPLPPPGVDAGAFYDLVAARRRGVGDTLFQIDAAANNSSIVFSLEWRGWRLLFPGDAEERSWKTMKREKKLKPVHFLKVGHHGSHNGTPPPELLDEVLPLAPADDRRRYAGVSTCKNVYGETVETAVPHEATMGELRRRCEVVSVEGPVKGAFKDFTFPG